MIDKEIIMKLAKQAGMNFTPAQFPGFWKMRLMNSSLRNTQNLSKNTFMKSVLRYAKIYIGDCGFNQQNGNVPMQFEEQ